MLGEVSWAELTLGGAFAVGAALATFATLRVMRIVLSTFDDRAKRSRTDRLRDEVEHILDQRKDQPRD